ncbi:MAG: hypothetical protein J5I93_25670 [Pirellulaceae bacterium]|nr:hypothetical protein [Pirellulaceae bacterium]
MQVKTRVPTDDGAIEVDLRNPTVAALWAWLWPGAGHLYQRRYAKGILFMICILGTYFFGLALSGGHAVYASWTKTDKRWKYIFQVGVGLPALPALVQNQLVMNGKEPLLGGVMAPPRQPVRPDDRDQLAQWHERYHSLFELGELYTMVAGLLNVLAIYDALVGPAVPDEKSERQPAADDKRRKKKRGEPETGDLAAADEDAGGLQNGG